MVDSNLNLTSEQLGAVPSKGNGPAAHALVTGNEQLSADHCLKIYQFMARARALEERMIQMTKSGQAVFWVGGPGEEAFSVCLGMQIKRASARRLTICICTTATRLC